MNNDHWRFNNNRTKAQGNTIAGESLLTRICKYGLYKWVNYYYYYYYSVSLAKKHFLRNICKTLWRRVQAEKLLISSTPIVLNIITRYIKRSRKTPPLPKPWKTLLLSLAVSDVGVGVLVQPTYVAVLVMKIEQNADNSAYYTIFDAFYVQSCLVSFASFFQCFYVNCWQTLGDSSSSQIPGTCDSQERCCWPLSCKVNKLEFLNLLVKCTFDSELT